MSRAGASVARVAWIAALAWLHILPVCVPTVWGADDAPLGPPPPAVEFAAIEPILQARCVRCHGARNASGGLRLDATGATKKPQFASRDPEQNEIFARITTTDPAHRMPLGSPPLTKDEVATFRIWIAAGQPWPVKPGSPQAMRQADYLSESPWVDALSDQMGWLWPRGVVAVLLLAGILSFERLKLRSRAGNWPRWGLWRERFGQGSYLAGLTIIVLVVVIHAYHAHLLWLERKLTTSRVQLSIRDQEHPVIDPPPALVRPRVPKRLQSTYYRGNCERSENLFNGGHYCTAFMRLALYGQSGSPLTAGDDVTDQDLSVEFEIQKAPGATDALFTTEVMSAVQISKEYPRVSGDGRPPGTPPLSLEEVEPGQRWKVRIPVGKVGADGVTGVIYVCKDTSAHYGIQYELKTAAGRLTEDSDLWMNAIYLPANVAQPQQLPFREWLDHEPLPIITGPNSTDPKLLGIEEHLPGKKEPAKKGEPAPTPKTPGSQEPAQPSAPQPPVSPTPAAGDPSQPTPPGR